MPNLLIEEDFGWPYKSIAGVDEAGRGPWAGPVVSAAVVLNKKNIPSDLDDSKKVSEKRRQSLYSSIYDSHFVCLLYTSPSPRDRTRSRMPSSA